MSLTIYFIVEPPNYEVFACYLAASIREQFGADPTLIGYCPDHRIAELDPKSRTILDRLNCDLRSFKASGRFDPEYPHGNKLLATLEKRDTDFSCFMDSDILCIAPNAISNITENGAASLTVAASMNWAPQTIWEQIYGAAEMEIPPERYKLARQRNGNPRIPHFSSGLFSYPEKHGSADGKSFPETWMELAQTIDATPDIHKKRPYLDQMTLPLAIQKSGLSVNLLPEEQHFILGGRIRHEPFPKDRGIRTVHYRQWPLLRETRLARNAKLMLLAQAGVKRVSEVGTRKDEFGTQLDPV